MTIGFHYHIPVKKLKEGTFATRSFYGVFLDALANASDKLVVFAYEPINEEMQEINYTLTSRNIEIVSLGPHNALPKRIFRFLSNYRVIAAYSNVVDVFVVRTPTPLILVLSWIKRKKVIQYVVGDYIESSRALRPGIKTWLVKMLSFAVARAQRQNASGNLVITNSIALQNKFRAFARTVILIKSTTLKEDDIYYREDTCQSDVIKVLYTGRLDPAKGLIDIVEACGRVRSDKHKIEFHIAGGIVKNQESFLSELIKLGESNGITVVYHGLKSTGYELNSVYRDCDIYAIASTGYEGFPRTVWEAMANGLPVIASKVGSIPFFLEHENNAILFESRNVAQLENALKSIIYGPVVRKKIVNNGYLLAKENMVDVQAEKMVKTIRDYLLIEN